MENEKVVTVHQAKTHLSRLLREVDEGKEIVIARGRKPVARLVPVAKGAASRKLGTARGVIQLKPDFDEPLEDFLEYA